MIIDNRGGAGGALGARALAAAEPDGHTLFYGNTSTLAVIPAVSKNPGYDPAKNFAPIASVSESYMILVVHPSFPAKTVKEFLDYAKANPGKLNFGHAGAGNVTHLTGEMFRSLAKIDFLGVPHRGGAELITSLLGQQVDFLFESPVVLLPLIREGKLRALGVTSAKSQAGIPTMVEAGVPGFVATLLTGIVAPAGTPPATIDKLNGVINETLKAADMQELLTNSARRRASAHRRISPRSLPAKPSAGAMSQSPPTWWSTEPSLRGAKRRSTPVTSQLDCFAEPVIGPREARARWLPMTASPFARTKRENGIRVAEQSSGESVMKAGVASEKGVVVADIPQPRPKPNEVLVNVKAAALNRADLTTGRGLPHGPGGGIGHPIGIEWAGEVIEVGSEVKDVWPGERVMCSGNGGYAEFAVSDWGRTFPIPNGVSYEDAATLPVSLITLHNALITAGRMQPGDSVLIQGASSGVGLMGLQIAKLMGAKLVIGSSTNAERRARLKEFGAHLAIDTRDPTWPDQS